MRKPYGIEKIEQLEYDAKFKERLHDLVDLSNMSYSDAALNLMSEYDIKSWLKPLFIHYIQTGIIDETLAEDPVKVERASVYQDIRLVLPMDITQPILKDYITKSWAKKIAPRLSPFGRDRYTAEQFPELKQRIYEEYEKKSELGLTIRAIAYRNNVSESTVKRVIRAKKKA